MRIYSPHPDMMTSHDAQRGADFPTSFRRDFHGAQSAQNFTVLCFFSEQSESKEPYLSALMRNKTPAEAGVSMLLQHLAQCTAGLQRAA